MSKKRPPFHNLKNFLKQYHVFTASERKGIVALSMVLLLLIAVLMALKFYEPEEKNDFSALDSVVKQFEQLQKDDSMNRTKRNTSVDTAVIVSESLVLFRFNPNTLADSLWIKLGISERQLKTIRNFQSKGGHFRTRYDFNKLYTLTDKQREQLWPFIDLPDSIVYPKRDTTHTKHASSKQEKEIHPLYINIADAEDWQQLPYIGEGRAAAIVSYREKLGGFVDVNQLLEIKILNDTILDAIRPYLRTDAQRIRKININIGSAYDLRHPYLEPSLAKVIVNYRKVHGDYKDVEEIKKLGIMKNEDYERLVPYLTVQ